MEFVTSVLLILALSLVAALYLSWRSGVRHNKTVVWGKNRRVFLRLYPNACISFTFKDKAISLSKYNGIEIFKKDPTGIYRRVWNKFGRI